MKKKNQKLPDDFLLEAVFLIKQGSQQLENNENPPGHIVLTTFKFLHRSWSPEMLLSVCINQRDNFIWENVVSLLDT